MQASYDAFAAPLVRVLENWGIPVSAAQLPTLAAHFDAMVTVNRTMNLTRITDPTEAALKHYADSLALLPWMEACQIRPKMILDIGSGAGFPAVPLAVMRPDWEVTAVDATRKKVNFITRCASDLQLANLRAEHVHTRHWPTDALFDVVVMRALGSLAACLEQGARYVGRRGRIVVYKTASVKNDEKGDALGAAKRLRLRPAETFPYELELGGEMLHRLLFVYRKAR